MKALTQAVYADKICEIGVQSLLVCASETGYFMSNNLYIEGLKKISSHPIWP